MHTSSGTPCFTAAPPPARSPVPSPRANFPDAAQRRRSVLSASKRKKERKKERRRRRRGGVERVRDPGRRLDAMLEEEGDSTLFRPSARSGSCLSPAHGRLHLNCISKDITISTTIKHQQRGLSSAVRFSSNGPSAALLVYGAATSAGLALAYAHSSHPDLLALADSVDCDLAFDSGLAPSISRLLTDWWPTLFPGHSDAESYSSRSPRTTPDIMAHILPGRPETLTAEQEAKLKEFWNVTLALFKQSAHDLESRPSEDTVAPADPSADTPEPLNRVDSELSTGKKKRKLFGRSKKDKKDKKDSKDSSKDASKDVKDSSRLAPPSSGLSNRPSPPPGLTVDPEDKYNQGKDFKTALASQTAEQLRATFWSFVKYDNPDALLLRFLRARKWDVEKALVMMVSTMHWRGQEVFVEDIVREGELHAVNNKNDGFMHQLRVGKSYIHGVDKENRPVCVVAVRLHRASEQTPESLERYTVYLIETTRMLLKSPVDTACILFDMTGFGMANMDYSPVKFMIKCFEAHYPECLGVCLVHNAPWIFQGIWKIIRGWLDPVVASKVNFTSKPSDLFQFIDPSHLPKSLGGDEDWSYSYAEPSPTEDNAVTAPTEAELADKAALETERWRIVEEWERNTRAWIAEESKGAEVPTDVKDDRSGIRERLRTNYWSLDKYLRAKTYYDRIGMVGKNGDVDFYPSKNEKAVENGGGKSVTVGSGGDPEKVAVMAEMNRSMNGNGNTVPVPVTSDDDVD
ncbi:Patellin-5 [Drechslerella dactyloides]|uniref:Patellin-5 n=1 Tax=Drechslerella dactyloides TaxID=74499 RepID=A0AAD6IZW9_DREDA|nr:Patellin-5 [Drechslerella dactyloides]